MELTGLTLDEARAQLQASGVTRVVTVTETAPPQRPPARSSNVKAKKRNVDNKPRKVAQFGEWRVLRSRETGDGVELLVAREELAPVLSVEELSASVADPVVP